MRRREFIALPLAAAGSAVLVALARRCERWRVVDDRLQVPLRSLTEREARTVAAACERIFPSDASGLGASESGVVVYIDRQLAGPYGRDKYRYVSPPFVESIREHGYQGRETPREIYRTGCRALGDFADVPAAEQDTRLMAIETSRFFALLRAHTIEGMFSDPVHGGNADLAGWKLLGYPGPQMQYRNHIDAHYGHAWRPTPASLQQITGRTIVPSEDERV